MVEEEAPAQVATPAKAAKKRVVKPKNSTVPSVRELIVKTVAASKERKGVSAHALKKALVVGGYDVDSNKGRVRLTIRKLVDADILEQVKGIGASGSFKMSKKAAEPKTKKIVKKSPAKVKKPVAKKPPAAKKPKAKVVKKPVAAKATAVKKSPKKVKKSPAKKMSKSPRKVQKSPKKVEKKPKSPAAKKPAKKAAKPKAKKVAAKKK